MPRRSRKVRRTSLADLSRDLDRHLRGISLVSFDVFSVLLRPREEAEDASTEASAWVVAPGIENLLDQLHQTGLVIVALTDRRVESTVLRQLLEAKHLTHFFHTIHSSADVDRLGNALPLPESILKEHLCAPQSMLHIAGNTLKDIFPFQESGVQTLSLRHAGERKRRALLRHYSNLARNNRYWRGRHMLQIAQSDSTDLSNASFHYRYGREILGPVFCSYILALLERLDEIEPEHIYFVARDGYLLQELYRSIAPALGYTVRPHDYLYLSRRAAFAGSISEGLSLEKAQTVLNGAAPLELFSVLEAFGLDAEKWQIEAQRHGLKDIKEPLSGIEDPRLARFLADPIIQEKISTQGKAACRHLERYLDQQGFFDKRKIALVDIGWNGNSQLALSQLSQWRAGKNEMLGLYFAFVSGKSREFGGRNQAEGLWYDYREEPSPARVVIEYEEIFEESTRAPHATTLGYGENGMIVEPILKPDHAPDRAQELACNPLITELQRGTLDFASDFSTAIQLTGYTANDIKPFIQSLAERAIAFPSRVEISELTRLAHADDLGQNTLLDYSDLDRPRIKFPRRGRFMDEMRASSWRYAMLSGPLRVAYHLYRGVRRA